MEVMGVGRLDQGRARIHFLPVVCRVCGMRKEVVRMGQMSRVGQMKSMGQIDILGQMQMRQPHAQGEGQKKLVLG